jgi:hypothetical protein
VPEARPATPAFERFARETLGCQCAPEVFARVEDEPSPLPALPGIGRRIAVGGRLLIYLVWVSDAMRAASGLGAWVAAGLAERDGRGMNRLRLVVVLDDPSPEAVALIESAFRGLPDLDDRVHLHVLATAALAGI